MKKLIFYFFIMVAACFWGNECCAQTNLALNKTAEASTTWSATYPASKAFDGDASSRWSATASALTDQWLQADLGANTTFDRIVVTEYQSRIASYQVQYSDDPAGTWNVAYDGTGKAIVSGAEIVFTPVSSRYIRLYILSASKEPSIYEMGVYYQAAAANLIPYVFTNDIPTGSKGVVPIEAAATKWHSALVTPNSDGTLAYHKDSKGFILPDFSHAGYKNGDEAIPNVPVVKEIAPLDGVDNTQHIQAAINEVGALPPDANGIRGALMLKKGLYRVKGPITVTFSGVVIRGEGNGGDPASNTVIFDDYRDDVSFGDRSIFMLGGATNDAWTLSSNNREYILDDTVHVGSYSFRITKNENYKVGDLVSVNHPSTANWLAAIAYGGNTNGDKWTTSTAPIAYHRYVTKVVHSAAETEITLDAPVFYDLVKSLTQCDVFRFTSRSLQKIGIENLRIDEQQNGGTDEYHARHSVYFRNAENCWAKNVVALHFTQSGFITERTTRTTIEDCYSLDPVGQVTGERMYNYNNYVQSQLILFKNCYARGGRHNFISNGTSKTSGCVVYNCKSEGSRASSEGHRYFTQGMLFDSYEDFDPYTDGVLGFYCRNNMGTMHGWGMVSGVIWRANLRTDQTTAANGNRNSRIYVEEVPTAQNYVIGSFTKQGDTGIRAYDTSTKTKGYVEGTNKAGLEPASLYYAQLQARHGGGLNIATEVKTPKQIVSYNQTKDCLYIEAASKIKSLKIYDLTGHLVADSNKIDDNSRAVSMASLTKGMYLVTLETAGAVETHKIIKN
ncbi:MAG: discoidin domain-containing protein [Prevotella sp.]|nr:discoidin domain-containing protein [Prevotella sp.]